MGFRVCSHACKKGTRISVRRTWHPSKFLPKWLSDNGGREALASAKVGSGCRGLIACFSGLKHSLIEADFL